jgi:hypothetical protein
MPDSSANGAYPLERQAAPPGRDRELEPCTKSIAQQHAVAKSAVAPIFRIDKSAVAMTLLRLDAPLSVCSTSCHRLAAQYCRFARHAPIRRRRTRHNLVSARRFIAKQLALVLFLIANQVFFFHQQEILRRVTAPLYNDFPTEEILHNEMWC